MLGFAEHWNRDIRDNMLQSIKLPVINLRMFCNIDFVM